MRVRALWSLASFSCNFKSYWNSVLEHCASGELAGEMDAIQAAADERSITCYV